MESSIIQYFHAHIYYGPETLEEAKNLREKAGEMFGLELGRLHERPVGPHLPWSCQLSVPKEQFAEVISWLALNRGRLDFFIHPVTGNDYDDHAKYAMWLGKSYDLNLTIFTATGSED